MTKIVYNACYGGFSLSEKAIKRYWELKGETYPEHWWSTNLLAEHWWDRSIDRADPILVRVVEELGESASGGFAELKIRALVKGTLYRIDEYDGFEQVMTQNDYDWRVA